MNSIKKKKGFFILHIIYNVTYCYPLLRQIGIFISIIVDIDSLSASSLLQSSSLV